MVPESFYSFYSLPLELRLKIWSLTLPPRTIHIKLLNVYRPNRTLLPSPIHYSPKDIQWQRLSTLFYVCQQSRIELQTLYHPLTSPVFRATPGELVNWQIDTVLYQDILLDLDIMAKSDTIKAEVFYP